MVTPRGLPAGAAAVLASGLVAALVWIGYAHQLLGLPPTGPPWLPVLVLGPPLLLLPGAALLAHREDTPEPGRPLWSRLMGLGLVVYAVGQVGGRLAQQLGVPVALPVPGPGSTTWPELVMLAASPLILAGLLAALRPHLRRLRLIVALDGLTGSLAGAAFAAWAITPLAAVTWDGSVGSAVLLGQGLGDAALVAAGLGAVGMARAEHRRRFATMTFGLVVFVVGDLIRVYQLAVGNEVAGTWTDLLVALGLSVLALGAVGTRTAGASAVPGPGAFGVPVTAAVTAVAVLTASPGWAEAPRPTTLALLALVAVGVRFVLFFRELHDLAVVREQALTDELTGVANRRALYARLDRLLETLPPGTRPDRHDSAAATATATAEATPPAGAPAEVGPDAFTLALIDLDHFKEVNDTLGHAAGDELLKAVVGRFAAALEELSTPFLLARLGGDEFAVVLSEAAGEDAALIVGEALRESLAEPILVEGALLHAQASIGLALAPRHGTTRGDLLLAADAAMYEAKTAGSSVALHAPATASDRRQRLVVAEDLFTAIERHELRVVYQPIATTGGGVVGVEALLRWEHPDRGTLAPGEFLEAAERYRLTHRIAERVLDIALGDTARWRAAGADVRVSVNVSASDLRDESVVHLVTSALLEHRLPPEALVIEVTETAMMTDPARSLQVLRALDELGVGLSVDDYGTGFSSLQYLLDLPVDELKLSRTFVAGVTHEDRARAIVASTIDLTHALGLRMVAEGVESAATLGALDALGCDLVQGWHVGRPVSAPELWERLVSSGGRHLRRDVAGPATPRPGVPG